jgi:hypothetical protein
MKTNVYITVFTGFALILLASLFILIQVSQSDTGPAVTKTSPASISTNADRDADAPVVPDNSIVSPSTPDPLPLVEDSVVSDVEPVACPADAKICPDGTSVGRTGPNCEFSACPVLVEDPAPQDTVACTMDAMLCPDGTYVGRTGPNCEFVCPTDPVVDEMYYSN